MTRRRRVGSSVRAPIKGCDGKRSINDLMRAWTRAAPCANEARGKQESPQGRLAPERYSEPSQTVLCPNRAYLFVCGEFATHGGGFRAGNRGALAGGQHNRRLIVGKLQEKTRDGVLGLGG